MNKAFILIYLAAVGLIFGSFVNAFVWRFKQKRDWVRERSECPHCHHVLTAKDLVPVFSFILLKGKCRYCGKKIEDTPLPEIATSLLFVLSYLAWPVELQGVGLFQFICWLVVLVVFMVLTVYDLKWFLLPDKIVFPLIGFVVAQLLAQKIFYHFSWHELGVAALAAALLSGIFYILFVMSDGTWIGGGDVKLAIALGLLAGDPFKTTLLLFAASTLGVLVSLPMMMRKKGKSLKMQIPFGPFLIAATIFVQLFGSPIVHWYSQILSV